MIAACPVARFERSHNTVGVDAAADDDVGGA